jgi:uncharacterized protein YraI
MTMYLSLLAFAFFLLVPAEMSAQTSADSYLCNFARVKKHLPQGRLNVRSGPSTKFRRVDRLHSEQTVYTCDERGDWYQVFYGGPDRPCGSTTSEMALEVRKTTSCLSGWVTKKWIVIISG